jgi:hypothetical protein
MGEWMHRSMFSWSRFHLEISGQLHASADLPAGEECFYPFDRRPSDPQSLWMLWGVKTLDPTGTRTPIPQSLYRLRYRGSLVVCCHMLQHNAAGAIFIHILRNYVNSGQKSEIIFEYFKTAIFGPSSCRLDLPSKLNKVSKVRVAMCKLKSHSRETMEQYGTYWTL